MFEIVKSTEIEHRRDFSLLCNWRRLYRAIEIGTDKAEFALEFLEKWIGHTLLCIDPYEPYEEMPWNRDGDYHTAIQRLSAHGARVKLIREKSPDVLSLMAPIKYGAYRAFDIDFVYIDGSHLYERTKADIEAWWERLTPIGMLAGHDFDDEHDGVKRAVTEFAEANGLRVQITHETDSPPSWYIYRNEPGAGWKRLHWAA